MEEKKHLFYIADELPERQVLKLSDLYMKPMDDPELELKVTVLNINNGMNWELVELLTKLLLTQNRYEDLKRATTDIPYREQLFKEFNL